MNAYVLSFAVLLMTGAALGDRFGRRRMFAAGLGLFVAASAACALAPHDRLADRRARRAGRRRGAGDAARDGAAERGVPAAKSARKALGIFSGVTGLALIAGPVVGGAIAEGVAWQWIFWLNVPIGLIVIPLVLRRVPESFGPGTALDIPGLVLVTGAALRGSYGG